MTRTEFAIRQKTPQTQMQAIFHQFEEKRATVNSHCLGDKAL